MFTDIVTSTDLVGVIGDEAWSELLGWHDRELRSAVAQHRGEVVNTTGDGFFVAFEDAMRRDRLCRRYRAQARSPPSRARLRAVRSGSAFTWPTATRRGRDYSGQGVHVAARVGAAAGPGEILATSAVLTQPTEARFNLSEPRMVTLKGVREPLEVRTIDWR